MTLKAPLSVSAPVPPSVPLLSSIVGAAMLNGLLTLTVAPPINSVPRPEKLAPVSRLRVPPEKFSVVPAATAYAPVSVPPPSSASVPATRLSVPLLCKPIALWVLRVPLPLRLKMPALLKVAVPPKKLSGVAALLVRLKVPVAALVSVLAPLPPKKMRSSPARFSVP